MDAGRRDEGGERPPDADEMPATRLRRSAVLGRLAATEAAKYAGTYAANLTRSPQDAEDAIGRRQVEAAQQMVRVLGSMKGVAMKLGQMLSVADLSAVPEAYRGEVQASLDQLRGQNQSVHAARRANERNERGIRPPDTGALAARVPGGRSTRSCANLRARPSSS